MKNRNKNILCIGEVLWDVFPDHRNPGGAPVNVAIHLSRLGHKTQMVSRVGDDQNGQELLEFLRENGLKTDHIQIDPNLPTSEVLVSLDKNSNATFEIPQPVAWDNLAYSKNMQKLSKNASVIIYGTLGSRNAVSRGTILKVLNSNALKLIDVNLRPPYTAPSVVKELLSLADAAKLNEDELMAIADWHGQEEKNTEALMQWIAREFQLQMVIVTRGENGAIVYDNVSFYEHPGYRIDVKDTVGAGDAFLAGFVSSQLLGAGPGEAANFACAAGAYVASQEGATPLYRKEQITNITNEN